MYFFQFRNRPLFSRNIIFPGYFPKASVTGNDNPYSGMVIDYFPCADFRSLSERDFIRRPGGFYHPFRIFFHVAAGAIHHIAHTVNKAYIHIDVIIQCDFGRFFRNEFRLCGCNRFPACALRQFILCPYFFVFLCHIRKHHNVHKAFDKGSFSSPYRAYHSYVNFPSGTGLNIFV